MPATSSESMQQLGAAAMVSASHGDTAFADRNYTTDWMRLTAGTTYVGVRAWQTGWKTPGGGVLGAGTEKCTAIFDFYHLLSDPTNDVPVLGPLAAGEMLLDLEEFGRTSFWRNFMGIIYDVDTDIGIEMDWERQGNIIHWSVRVGLLLTNL